MILTISPQPLIVLTLASRIVSNYNQSNFSEQIKIIYTISEWNLKNIHKRTELIF